MATITTLPTPPSKTDLTNFDSRADAFLTALPNFGDEANDVRDEVVALKNTTSGYADAAALSATAASSSESVAIAAANYDGAWTAKSYTVPASVSHLGALWVLEEAAADTDIPGTSTKWTFWSLTEYPIEVNPTLDLDFENQVYKSYVDHSGLTEWSLNGVDSKLTFTRATTKTYFDALGIMQTASAGEIAIDYDPDTGACNGFQPEGPATNLLEQSEDFSNAAWTKTRSSIGGTAVVVPDGSSVVCKLIEDSTLGLHQAVQPVTVVSGTTYTASVFAEAGEREVVGIALPSLCFPGTGSYIAANLITGAVTYPFGVPLDGGVEDIGNGWFRVWITQTADASDTGSLSLEIYNEMRTYTGDGTSGLYIWGAQVEAASAKSSYIPTTTEEATRAADEMSMEGTDFSEWFSDTKGTFVVEANTVSGENILTAGTFTIDSDSSTMKKYSDTYPADPSATELTTGNGKIRRIRYYPVELTATQQAALTRS